MTESVQRIVPRFRHVVGDYDWVGTVHYLDGRKCQIAGVSHGVAGGHEATDTHLI